MRQQQGQPDTVMNVRIEAKPVDQALAILATYGNASITEGTIQLEQQRYESIPDIVEALVTQGIRVYGTSYQNKLEDAYFSLTEEQEVSAG